MSTDPNKDAAPAAGPTVPPMPASWRLTIGVAVVVLGTTAYLVQDTIGPRGQAVLGLCCFLGLVASLSANLRAVNWRTIGWGIFFQIVLAVAIIKIDKVRIFFDGVVSVVKTFLGFTHEGSKFIFGRLVSKDAMDAVFGKDNGFVFAFSALPTIIFVASFFTILYYAGILQFVVRVMARLMMYLMQTSGAETLSVTANIVMGQTEAPLIVKPYIPRMTRSELLTMMVGGMAHTSGAIFGIYMDLGADPVALLATSVMAAPCSLYLSKLFLPETGQPETRGEVRTEVEQQHANVVDAAAAGAADGMRLALNIAAMLIAFIALIALVDAVLHQVDTILNMINGWLGRPYADEIKLDLSLSKFFSWFFSPVAMLMGVERADVPAIADLLGTKLVLNELVAYGTLKDKYIDVLSERSRILATYALTGFANFASIGIQVGGIGGLAPNRRHDLARLGGRALFVGFLVTLINAAFAGILL
jgi:CNT family concentrative nucleoside transporter